MASSTARYRCPGDDPAADAISRFFGLSWQLPRRYPLLLDPALNRSLRVDGSDPHRR
ncbi:MULTISPECIES: hypothetical protein [Amycolatopsis]|uniref:Uncharacterized protein n=2 Tax=Amycolatopsis TaxID=1813 RepID=A0A1I3ZH06_9PSEU|nr:hypothetical protein [Amycolatopsis sacchari]SFK43414.1 hypothetical protein SAMN05421835_12122 [Amycolatopsis sacchari]